MPRHGWWAEPHDHREIRHVEGCISRLGCRCAAYGDLNPRRRLPAYLRAELDEIDAELEERTRAAMKPGGET
jgi:hypothetical protein